LGLGFVHNFLRSIIYKKNLAETVSLNRFQTLADKEFYIFCSGILQQVSRVARWFVFKPKIAIWVNFGGPCIAKC
jgi:hypothetical protein